MTTSTKTNIQANLETGEIGLKNDSGQVCSLSLTRFAEFDRKQPIFCRQWFSELNPKGTSAKEAFKAFTREYHITPTKMQKLGERLFYKHLMVVYGKDLVTKLCYGRSGITVTRVQKLAKSFDKVKLAVADKQHNMLPLVVATGKSVKEIKDSCTKSTWKKLINNSFSRNKLIAEYADSRSVRSQASFGFIATLPSTLLKNMAFDITALHGLEQEMVDWVVDKARQGRFLKDKAKVRKLYNTLRDVRRMCQQFDVQFNIKWGLKRVEELHEDFTKRLREQRESKNKEQSESLSKPIEYGNFPLNSFTYLDGKIEVSLLASGNEVMEEGRTMHHCVGGYATSCMKETYAVFSLKSEADRSTLGVTQTGVQYSTIVGDKQDSFSWKVQQHYSYCNSEPSKQHNKVVDFIKGLL